MPDPSAEAGPDWVARLDQAKRSMVDVAAIIAAYFAALRNQGFSDDQALALTIAYQHRLLGGS